MTSVLRPPSSLLRFVAVLCLLSSGLLAQDRPGGGGSSLPSQTGNNGKYLTTNGTAASWATVSGSGTVSSGTTGYLSKYTGSTTVGNSAATDDGTTFTYTGTGGIVTSAGVTTGSGGSAAGYVQLGQGTAPSTGTTAVTLAAPTSVTSYLIMLPSGVSSTGLLQWTVSGSTATLSSVATLPTAFVPAFTGDVTNSAGSLATTVGKINGTSLAGLATGILKNTTTTGVPSIAIAADFPTLNQNTSGTASNVSGTPALPNGTTATKQGIAAADDKLATDSYVNRAVITNTAPGALGSLTGTINIDWSTSNNFYGTLTGNTTFTFSNAVAGQVITVQVIQTGTNSYTSTWPSAKWPGGTAPVQTAGAAAHDDTTFLYINSAYDGSSIQNLK